MFEVRDAKSQFYTRNVHLVDEGSNRILLQRLGPPSQHAWETMKAKSERGKVLFERVLATATCTQHPSQSNERRLCSPFRRFRFGAWYDPEEQALDLTPDTRQADNDAGREAVASFQAWVRTYVADHIEPLVGNAKHGLCSEFRRKLEDRMKIHFPWAAKQIPGLEDTCHPLYSTFSTAQGFTRTSHMDYEDANIAVLMNFGQHALLELRHYNCQLLLNPLDMVFFDSSAIYHRTLQHPAHVLVQSNPEERFAVTCSFGKALLPWTEPKQQTEPTRKSAVHLAKQAASREQQWKKARARKPISEASVPKASGCKRKLPRVSASPSSRRRSPIGSHLYSSSRARTFSSSPS